MSAFINNDRGFSTTTIYMLAVPLAYFFNYYFSSKKFFSFIMFGVLLAAIIFSQQRTSWVACFGALFLSIIFMKRTNFKIDFGGLVPIFITLFIISVFISSFVLTNEAIMEKFAERFSGFTSYDSEDRDEGGTTAFRKKQIESYVPYFEQYPFFGMRMKGFELPVQFYDTDEATWEDGTGHHFHSFYADKIFYFGFVGLLIYVVPFVIRLINLAFFVRKYLILPQTVMLSFSLTILFYGISYDLATFVYGFLGYTFHVLEQDYTNTQISSQNNKTQMPENKEVTKEIYAVN
jgi:cell division protein FtsW (lipid II flippase)